MISKGLKIMIISLFATVIFLLGIILYLLSQNSVNQLSILQTVNDINQYCLE